MKFKPLLQSVCIIVLLLGATACVRVDTSKRLPTMGEQLLDLTRAYQAGSITQQEFEQLKQRLISQLSVADL